MPNTYSNTSYALDLAKLFNNQIICKFRMPIEIVNDRDNSFLSNIWFFNENALMLGGFMFKILPLDL